MCIIIYTPNGVIPKKHLEESLRVNGDGYGYIFRNDDGKMIVRKGLKNESFWKIWQKDMSARLGKKLIFHARIQTSGKIQRRNCHPFRTGKERLWLAHNGILHDHEEWNSPLQDTQHFIQEIINQLPTGWFNNRILRRLVEGYVSPSKMALMTSKGNVILLNADQGVREGKRWYSNTSFRKKVVVTYGIPQKKKVPTPTAKTYHWDSVNQRLVESDGHKVITKQKEIEAQKEKEFDAELEEELENNYVLHTSDYYNN